jgi:hypothetical protein
MGKLLLSALLGGIVAAVVTFFLLATLDPGERKAAVEARMLRAEESSRQAADEAAAATRRIELLQRRLESASLEHVRTVARIEEAMAQRPAAGADGDAPPPPAAPDGSPYVSRAEMEAAIAKARASGGITVAAAARAEAKTVDEIARDLNLSASETESVRTILRSSEEEALQCLFGERSMSEIQSEVRAARDDPEKMQELVGASVGRAFQNIGKLMTLESRTKKRVADVLGKDRAKEFLAKPRRPVLGEEFQQVFQELDLE